MEEGTKGKDIKAAVMTIPMMTDCSVYLPLVLSSCSSPLMNVLVLLSLNHFLDSPPFLPLCLLLCLCFSRTPHHPILSPLLLLLTFFLFSFSLCPFLSFLSLCDPFLFPPVSCVLFTFLSVQPIGNLYQDKFVDDFFSNIFYIKANTDCMCFYPSCLSMVRRREASISS